jgi:hypothetical protein
MRLLDQIFKRQVRHDNADRERFENRAALTVERTTGRAILGKGRPSVHGALSTKLRTLASIGRIQRPVSKHVRKMRKQKIEPGSQMAAARCRFLFPFGNNIESGMGIRVSPD